jgi:hypothetical protein
VASNTVIINARCSLRIEADQRVIVVTGQRVADAAPIEPAFDARWHQPGYRTFDMVRDALGGPALDAAGDPVEAARRERIGRMSDAWRNPPGLRDWQININYGATQTGVNEAGGGQVASGDPDAIDREKARASRTQGAVYPDDDLDDAAAAYGERQRRLGGSLLLHRDGLPPTFCRSPGAPVHHINSGLMHQPVAATASPCFPFAPVTP